MREIKFRVWDASPIKDGYPGIMIDHDYVINSDYLISGINGKYPIMQFSGLKDKNGVDIYEGDILRWFELEIEYQTHEGDNIPLGSYTEPCGIISKKVEKQVVFIRNAFTTYSPDPEEEVQYEQCPLVFDDVYDRERLNGIFWPRPYGRENEVLSDDDFLDTCIGVATNLGFECASIEDFISKINGCEIIGNIYENTELIN